jgi:hypothetical protein
MRRDFQQKTALFHTSSWVKSSINKKNAELLFAIRDLNAYRRCLLSENMFGKLPFQANFTQHQLRKHTRGSDKTEHAAKNQIQQIIASIYGRQTDNGRQSEKFPAGFRNV